MADLRESYPCTGLPNPCVRILQDPTAESSAEHFCKLNFVRVRHLVKKRGNDMNSTSDDNRKQLFQQMHEIHKTLEHLLSDLRLLTKRLERLERLEEDVEDVEDVGVEPAPKQADETILPNQ